MFPAVPTLVFLDYFMLVSPASGLVLWSDPRLLCVSPYLPASFRSFCLLGLHCFLVVAWLDKVRVQLHPVTCSPVVPLQGLSEPMRVYNWGKGLEEFGNRIPC